MAQHQRASPVSFLEALGQACLQRSHMPGAELAGQPLKHPFFVSEAPPALRSARGIRMEAAMGHGLISDVSSVKKSTGPTKPIHPNGFPTISGQLFSRPP